MERLTPDNLKTVCYDTWELCGLDSTCKRDCNKPTPCKIPKMIYLLGQYEDTGLTPEKINKVVSGAPVKVSFDIGDEGFLTAINGAFKERFGITADECSKTISDLQSERDTLKKALELACEVVTCQTANSEQPGMSSNRLMEYFVKQVQEEKDNAK